MCIDCVEYSIIENTKNNEDINKKLSSLARHGIYLCLNKYVEILINMQNVYVYPIFAIHIDKITQSTRLKLLIAQQHLIYYYIKLTNSDDVNMSILEDVNMSILEDSFVEKITDKTHFFCNLLCSRAYAQVSNKILDNIKKYINVINLDDIYKKYVQTRLTYDENVHIFFANFKLDIGKYKDIYLETFDKQLDHISNEKMFENYCEIACCENNLNYEHDINYLFSLETQYELHDSDDYDISKITKQNNIKITYKNILILIHKQSYINQTSSLCYALKYCTFGNSSLDKNIYDSYARNDMKYITNTQHKPDYTCVLYACENLKIYETFDIMCGYIRNVLCYYVPDEEINTTERIEIDKLYVLPTIEHTETIKDTEYTNLICEYYEYRDETTDIKQYYETALNTLYSYGCVICETYDLFVDKMELINNNTDLIRIKNNTYINLFSEINDDNVYFGVKNFLDYVASK